MTMAEMQALGTPRFTSTHGWRFGATEDDDVTESNEPTSTAKLAQDIARPASLFDLTGALVDMLYRYDAAMEDGEVDIAEAIEAEFLALGDDFDAKADAYTALIREAQARADAIKAEEQRLREHRAAHERKAERLTQSLKAAMIAVGAKKAGTLRTASVVANGGKTPVEFDDVSMDELEALDLVRVKLEADMNKIRAELEAGTALPFARLVERGTHLRIK